MLAIDVDDIGELENKLKKLGFDVEKTIVNGYIRAHVKTNAGKKLVADDFTVESYAKYLRGLLDGYKVAKTTLENGG